MNIRVNTANPPRRTSGSVYIKKNTTPVVGAFSDVRRCPTIKVEKNRMFSNWINLQYNKTPMLVDIIAAIEEAAVVELIQLDKEIIQNVYDHAVVTSRMSGTKAEVYKNAPSMYYIGMQPDGKLAFRHRDAKDGYDPNVLLGLAYRLLDFNEEDEEQGTN